MSASEAFELRVRDLGDGETWLSLREGDARREVKSRFSPPASAAHQQQRRAYFAQNTATPDAERSMDNLGRALGERLCDSEYELLEFMNRVEAAGIGELRIVIESQRPEFLAQPWELMTLPDHLISRQPRARASCAPHRRTHPSR